LATGRLDFSHRLHTPPQIAHAHPQRPCYSDCDDDDGLTDTRPGLTSANVKATVWGIFDPSLLQFWRRGGTGGTHGVWSDKRTAKWI